MKSTEQREWVNWSESLRFTPGQTVEPQSEDDVAELVADCAAEGAACARSEKGIPRCRSSKPTTCWWICTA